MKYLALITLCFSISKAQFQNPLALPQNYAPTNYQLAPTNQQFHQYDFTPQSNGLMYSPSNIVPLASQPVVYGVQHQSPKSAGRSAFINVPVETSYQISDQPLDVAGAHAYPVQHSVIVNHGGYDAQPTIYNEQPSLLSSSPSPRVQNIPPSSRPLPPQFRGPINQQLSPPAPPYKSYGSPLPLVNQNIRGPPNRANQYIGGPQKLNVNPNLPYNFKVVPPPALGPYQPQAQNPARIRVPVIQQQTLHQQPQHPYVKTYPLPPRPLPLPAPTPTAAIKPVTEEERREDDNSSREEEKERKSVEENDDEEDEEESRREEDEEEDEDNEEQEERAYPSKKYKYHENTDFDKRRYRPTFDAAKYIFNERKDDGEEEEEEDDEEEEEEKEREDSREEREDSREEAPRKKNKHKQKKYDYNDDTYDNRVRDAGPRKSDRREKKRNRSHNKRAEEPEIRQSLRRPYYRELENDKYYRKAIENDDR